MTHKPFVLVPLPHDWLNDEPLEPLEPLHRNIKLPAPELAKLRDLAARAVARTNERASMRPMEDSATSLMQALSDTHHNGNSALPTSYKNATLSPYSLITSAVDENKRHRDPFALPKVIYISDALLKQLPKDMRYCVGEVFQGSIPFFQPDGKKRYVPVVSAKNALDIMLPKDTVVCAN